MTSTNYGRRSGSITPNTVLRSKDFRQGYTDYDEGDLPREDWEVGRPWFYEAGRQFAAATGCEWSPDELKPRGGSVRPDAVDRFYALILDGTICW